MKSLKLFTILSAMAIQCFVPSIHASEENFYSTYQELAISSGAGTPWNGARHLELVKKASVFRFYGMQTPEGKLYPISKEDLQELYETAESTTIPFFAYSSMIDKDSGAVKAISPEGAATQLPAIAFGIQRTFNREMLAAIVEKGWGPLARPNDLAILNVFRKADAVLNGVVFDLPITDLLILCDREVGYDLIPIIAMRWDEAVDGQKNPQFFLAYTFKAPDYTGEGFQYTNSTVNPIPGYFNFLQRSLNIIEDDFQAMWWNTTYLADKKTLVNELPYSLIDLKGTSNEQ